MPDRARPSTTSPLALAGLVLALVVLGLLVWRTAFLIDDAFISFRYARNWVEHGVPAYHPDARPPVEGYSNFLWVVLLSAAYSVGAPMEAASQWLGVLFGALTLLVLHLHLARTLRLPPLAVALGDLTLAAFPPFAVWCTGGLETSLFAFTVLGSYAALTARSAARWPGPAAGVLGLAVALTRVEGFAWVLVVAACAWLGTPPEERRRRRRRVALFFAIHLAGYGAFLLWRHGVYGEWMANTVHAKAGFTAERLVRGVKTTASFLLLFPSALVALGAAAWTARGPHGRAALAATALLVAFLGYDLLVGGDWMPFFRFLAPGAPAMAIGLAVAFARLRPAGAVGLAGGCALLSLLPVYDVQLLPRDVRVALDFRGFEQAGYQTERERWRRSVHNLETIFLPLGRALGQVATEEDSLTFGAIGAVGWESDMRLHDYNGLVDREVARQGGTTVGRSAGHDKAVPRAFFLEREPTMFHAVLVPPGVIRRSGADPTADGPAVRDLVRRLARPQIERRVFSNPAEEVLRERTHVEVYPLEPAEGLPEGTWLAVLRAD